MQKNLLFPKKSNNEDELGVIKLTNLSPSSPTIEYSPLKILPEIPSQTNISSEDHASMRDLSSVKKVFEQHQILNQQHKFSAMHHIAQSAREFMNIESI
jgi:hypothetical protein